jgi:HD-GYP domain-containing protein (c-di-GMP phosphodiesterase class II)
MTVSFAHEDSLKALQSKASLSEKLRFLHDTLRERYDFIDRIAITVYDAQLDLLKTFAWSSEDRSPLTNYQYKLSESESLMEILQRGQPRVVNDLAVFAGAGGHHSQVINRSGYSSSYTTPMYKEDDFIGFIFFNSTRKHVFTEPVLADLDMVAHMLSLMVSCEKMVLETLQATVRSAMHFTHHRDPETAEHIDRMARYSRLIARDLAEEYQLDDQFVEHIFLFSPLHDLGKIGIPDEILLKPGRLDEREFALMKTHAQRGKDLIDELLRNYGLDGVGYVDMLRNIALHHHENVDGSGYPGGLRAEDIPIEARIVSVADVFDALTSERPYKKAWDNDRAFQALRDMAGHKLDRRCVEILIIHRDEVEEIQRRFQENRFG